MAIAPFALTGSLSGSGVTNSVLVYGPFVASLWGEPTSAGFPVALSGTVQIERSPDGLAFIPVGADGYGTPAAYTSGTSVGGAECKGALYRFNCTVYTSGTIGYSLVGPGVFPGWVGS